MLVNADFGSQKQKNQRSSAPHFSWYVQGTALPGATRGSILATLRTPVSQRALKIFVASVALRESAEPGHISTQN
jgi:hypothetical protein